MNFIESLSAIKVENIYILNMIYYFSRFNILFVIKIINVEDMIRYLKFAFMMY